MRGRWRSFTVLVGVAATAASASAQQVHDFKPTEFHRFFSAKTKPALRIAAGDTVRTWSVDAQGIDGAGNKVSEGGNALTGPFYIEGAEPGDTLAVRLNRVRLNKDFAISGKTLMARTVDPAHLAEMQWDRQFNSRWKLDTERGVASLEQPTGKLKNFTVPLRPMLGCVAVAPPEDWTIRTLDSGRYGGNLDYNQIGEGTTVYLPVYHPGALLYLGDGHAAQGDGELTASALETSMDFEFTVNLIRNEPIQHPMAENAEFFMSIGMSGSLDDALRMATSGMVRWLQSSYGLSSPEAAMVMGFALKYDVAELYGTQISIVAKLPKTALAQLTRVAGSIGAIP